MSTAKRDYITSLQRDNERLWEILGCSEKSCESTESDHMVTVLSFEEVRRSACKVEGALRTYWMCTDPICKSHLASLKLGAGIEARTLNLLFSCEDPSRSPHRKRRISIQSATEGVPTVQIPTKVAAQMSSSMEVQSHLTKRQSCCSCLRLPRALLLTVFQFIICIEGILVHIEYYRKLTSNSNSTCTFRSSSGY